MNLARPLLVSLALGLVAAPAVAKDEAPRQEVVEGERDRAIMSSEAFLSGHPDLRNRLAALWHYRKGDYEEAFVRFRRAARYADKPSQGMVAEMLWKGQGVAMDRPAAYIWMDIASERGYRTMVVNRERYWAGLSEDERAQALAIGDELFLAYADKYAKPRLEREMKYRRRNTTGSRTGFTGNTQIEIPTPDGPRIINGSTFYDEKFWEPDKYWSLQDSDWTTEGKGTVEIGSLQTVGELAPPADEPEPMPADE